MMKKIIIIILVFSTYLAKAQNQEQFIYNYKNKSAQQSEEHILSLNKNVSYYQALHKLQRKVYIDSVLKIGAPVVVSNYKSIQLKPVIEKYDNFILRYEDVFGEKAVIEFPKGDFNWNLGKEIKTVGNKVLHQAMITYGGRDWIAWYNMEIPVQEGPYVFAGLPGLIEEIYDVEKNHHFLLKGAFNKKYKEEFYQPYYHHTYSKVSYKEFMTLLEQAKENPSAIFLRNMPISEVTEEKKKRFNAKFSKELNDNTIEQ